MRRKKVLMGCLFSVVKPRRSGRRRVSGKDKGVEKGKPLISFPLSLRSFFWGNFYAGCSFM